MDTNQPEGQPTTEVNVQAVINDIEDWIGGNVDTPESKGVDWMSLTVFLRGRLESLISNAKEEGKKETAAEVAPFLITLRVLNKESEDLSYSIDKWIAKHVLSSNNPKP